VFERDPALRETLEVHLAGSLTDEDRAVTARSSVTVREHGFLTHGDTMELIRTADLLFLPMHELPRGRRAGLVPGKTYEYLASGRPILAAVPEGDARELLVEAGNAHVCWPSDVDAIAEAVESEVSRWRAGRAPEAPRAEVVGRYERQKVAQRLGALFDSAIGKAPDGRAASSA
jgi:glycosyltransferase involved in cell wall biosynthesis